MSAPSWLSSGVIPHPSNHLPLANPQIWGHLVTKIPETLSLSSASGFQIPSTLSEFLSVFKGGKPMLKVRCHFVKSQGGKAQITQRTPHSPGPQRLHPHGEAVFPLPVLLIVQLNHFQVLLPYCSPLSFFILEISTSDGLSFCLKPTPKK
jgi:hypothetical protein